MGYNLLDDILGAEWGFKFIRYIDKGLGVEYEKWTPRYFITSEITSTSILMKEICNINIVKVYANSFEDIINKLKECISNNKLAIFAVDVKYLDYFDEYLEYHSDSQHYILVYGFDEKNIFFVDSSRAFINGIYHKVSYLEFKNMIQPEPNIFHLEKYFMILEEVNDFTPINRRKSWNIFKQSINNMLISDRIKSVDKYEYLGLHGLSEFCKELNLIAEWGNEKILKNYLWEFFFMVVLCCQQRKANMNFLRKNLYLPIDEKNKILIWVNYIFKQWNKLKICLYNVRKEESSKIIKKATIILKEIHEKEKEFLEFINKI